MLRACLIRTTTRAWTNGGDFHLQPNTNGPDGGAQALYLPEIDRAEKAVFEPVVDEYNRLCQRPRPPPPDAGAAIALEGAGVGDESSRAGGSSDDHSYACGPFASEQAHHHDVIVMTCKFNERPLNQATLDTCCTPSAVDIRKAKENAKIIAKKKGDSLRQFQGAGLYYRMRQKTLLDVDEDGAADDEGGATDDAKERRKTMSTTNGPK